MAAKTLAEEFAEPPAKARADKCNVGRAIAEHEEGEVIGRVVADVRWSAASIVRVLGQHGITVSASSVRAHRRGECACAK